MIDTKEQRAEFAGLLYGLADVYNRPLGEQGVLLYWAALQPYPFEDIRKAAERHINDGERGRFMPLVSDFTRYLSGEVSQRAEQAWRKVHDAVRHYGTGRSVCFDDKAIHAALKDIGGFKRLCVEKSETMPFRQREFVAAYSHYEGQENYPYPAMFVGEGYKPELVLVGDRQKAIAVNKQARALANQSAAEDFPTEVTQLVGNVLASMQEKS